MLVSDFDFFLPEGLIAQSPLADRSASRMLHLHKATGRFEDRAFIDFPGLLRSDDLLVLNNSRVFPARLLGRRAGMNAQQVSPKNPSSKNSLHGEVEVLLTRQLTPWEWEALVRPGRKISTGEKIFFGPQSELQAEVTGRGAFGLRTLRFSQVDDFFALLERVGHVPLPPYIHRDDQPEDRPRYQTVYARPEATGSVAAPTAGLHFTPAVLEHVRQRGIEIAELTLHVGLGTFQPLHVDEVERHQMHRETYFISEQVAAQINAARAARRRVVAVGTTCVRTLEHAVRQTSGGAISPGRSEADIFIYPGFDFRVVSALLTNFHVPKSTLLMLVSAFAGRENIMKAYEHAVRERYRFFSYGDCMFIE